MRPYKTKMPDWFFQSGIYFIYGIAFGKKSFKNLVKSNYLIFD
jgi:hypothetical protein